MLKRELIAAMARRHPGLKVKDVDMMVRLVFETMAESITEGKNIELRGFGSFRLREYEPRQGRNPGTGESVNLGQRRGVLFKAGRKMKGRLNDK